MTDRLPSWIYAHQGPWTDALMDAYFQKYDPEGWAQIQSAKAAHEAARSAAVYFDPYQQATGEFLEYVCGRALT